jgi:hypothetical protein
MGKLIYSSEKSRKPLASGSSLYILLEDAIKKVAGYDDQTELITELWFSEKHDDYYVATYKKKAPLNANVTELSL